MPGCILTINAGSSSVKFALYQIGTGLSCVAQGLVQNIGPEAQFRFKTGGDPALKPVVAATQDTALTVILDEIKPHLAGQEIKGVGHRIVHGGPGRDRPERLSERVLEELSEFNTLAPLHQPHNLSAVRAAQNTFPDALQIGCFDTAFHRHHPWENDTYAIPRKYYDKGIKRYGFHGLSYDFVSNEIARDHPDLADKRLIICHLGSGASICGIKDGHSVSSTMGFSPLDGLPMSTRSGQLDPGILLYLLQEEGLSAEELSHLLYFDSGLLGLSGLSGDMRVLEASNSPQAQQAIRYFTHRVQREVGAMAATLSGVDALVFCGGIGENAPNIRAQIVERLGFLGIEIDAIANAQNARNISAGDTPVLVVPTDEEQVIADAVFQEIR